jgi:hypothetical protein
MRSLRFELARMRVLRCGGRIAHNPVVLAGLHHNIIFGGDLKIGKYREIHKGNNCARLDTLRHKRKRLSKIRLF